MYGRVAEWLERQHYDHVTRVRIPLRSIYQECEFLIKLAWESALHLWKVPENHTTC